MAARILNFILKYGFLDENQERNSYLQQAQKLYSQLPAINLGSRYSYSNIFRKDEGEFEFTPTESPYGGDGDGKMDLANDDDSNGQIKLKKFEEFKENSENDTN